MEIAIAATFIIRFVMIKTKDGVTVLKRSEVRSVVISDSNPERMIGDSEKKREIAIHVVKKGKPFTGKAEVGFVYIQRGIRWIPDYRIDIRNDSEARIRLQGTIINHIVITLELWGQIKRAAL